MCKKKVKIVQSWKVRIVCWSLCCLLVFLALNSSNLLRTVYLTSVYLFIYFTGTTIILSVAFSRLNLSSLLRVWPSSIFPEHFFFHSKGTSSRANINKNKRSLLLLSSLILIVCLKLNVSSFLCLTVFYYLKTPQNFFFVRLTEIPLFVTIHLYFTKISCILSTLPYLWPHWFPFLYLSKHTTSAIIVLNGRTSSLLSFVCLNLNIPYLHCLWLSPCVTISSKLPIKLAFSSSIFTLPLYSEWAYLLSWLSFIFLNLNVLTLLCI